MYPVDVEYLPQEEAPLCVFILLSAKLFINLFKIANSKVQRINPAPYLRLLERIDSQYPSTERGDMLIFMSGINEILTLADELKRYLHSSWL